MEIANNVKKRKRNTNLAKMNNIVAVRSSEPKMPRGKPSSPKKKASPHLKSLSKARKISARKSNTSGANEPRRVSRIVFSTTKKSTSSRRNKETPSKPAVYRTRNAASVAYEEKLMAVRAASQDTKKSTKNLTKKDSVSQHYGGNWKYGMVVNCA